MAILMKRQHGWNRFADGMFGELGTLGACGCSCADPVTTGSLVTLCLTDSYGDSEWKHINS